MDVLVTGGTGFVGREIVRQLRISGHRIHLLARHARSPGAREMADLYGAKVRVGDVCEPLSLREVCAGMDAVIHLVGIISEVGSQTFERLHLHGTQNMLFAAQDGAVKRFIQMSALGTRPGAVARYHQSKWAAEERVRRSSLGWTIFRPSIIYGPGDGFVNLFARMIRLSPVVPVMGDGRNQFQPVSVKTVAAAFVKALTDPGAIGETYDLCGPERLTFNQVLDEVLAVMRRRRVKVHLPLGIARIQAALLEFLFGRCFHQAPPLNRDQLIMLQEDNVGNPDPANERFGLKQNTFREGIAEYLK